MATVLWMPRRPFLIEVMVIPRFQNSRDVSRTVKKAASTLFLLLSCIFTVSTGTFAFNPRSPSSNTLWVSYPYHSYWGFSGEVVYACDGEQAECTAVDDSFYTDLIIVTLFYLPLRGEYPGFMVGWLFPYRKVGRLFIYSSKLKYTLRVRLLRVSGAWTP